MSAERNLRLVMDYLTGMPVSDLAARLEITPTRVYQILDKWALRYMNVFSIKHVNKDRMIARLRDLFSTDTPRFVENAETPEEFYVEMNNEPRVRNF